MSRTTCHMSISLDGFVAGPDQSRDDPLGVDGMRLHAWHLEADEAGPRVIDFDPDLHPDGRYAGL